MEPNLTGKIALVTGSTHGIGLSIAQNLSSEGCCVVLNSRTASDLELKVKEFTNSFGVVGDVSNPDDAKQIISDVIEQFGSLDILICNVGSGTSVPPGNETFDEWQSVFSKNLWSATNIIEAARSELSKTQGVVVCVSSICGMEVIDGAPVTYSVAKAALNAYVKAISRPLGKLNVRINAVAPGNILFEGSVWSRKLKEDANNVETMLCRDVALSRLGDPAEVADLVAFLASPRAAYATGSIWTLDGGQVHS